MTLRLNGSTSGYVEIDAPAVAGTSVLTLPTGTGTLATTNNLALVHINTTSFSGQSSVSFNNVFSATYDNYLVLASITHTGNNSAALRLRSGGTDNTSSNYDNTGYYGGTGSGNAIAFGTTDWGQVVSSNTTTRYISNTIVNPFASTSTEMLGSFYETTNAGSGYWHAYGKGHRSATSFDGFSFNFGVSSSGTIRVFGFKNS